MTTLTDTQLVILSQAAQREDGGVLLPERLTGNAAKATVSRLITKELIEEVGAAGSLPVWRRDDKGTFALRITPAGLAAIGVEPEGIEPGPASRTVAMLTKVSTTSRPHQRPHSRRARASPGPAPNRLLWSSASRPRRAPASRI